MLDFNKLFDLKYFLLGMLSGYFITRPFTRWSNICQWFIQDHNFYVESTHEKGGNYEVRLVQNGVVCLKTYPNGSRMQIVNGKRHYLEGKLEVLY